MPFKFNSKQDFDLLLSVPSIGEGPNVLDRKDQLNSWRYLRGQVMSKTMEERQNIIKSYLGVQTLKQAILYTDIMANENFDSDCLARLQRSDEYFGAIYTSLSDNKEQTSYQIIKNCYTKYIMRNWCCVSHPSSYS